jgi:hypothetical protein
LERTVPGRENSMSIWETETLILRLIAVLFVFALIRVCGRGKDTGRETVLYLVVVAASAIVNLLRSGGGGFLMTLIGAIAAFALSAPFVAKGRAAPRDITAAVAAGSLLGPLGGLIAVAIASVICIVQRSPGQESPLMDRFASRFRESAGPFIPQGRSILAIVENRRLRKGCGMRARGASAALESEAGDRSDIETIPWRTSLAVATLAMLMTGIFI